MIDSRANVPCALLPIAISFTASLSSIFVCLSPTRGANSYSSRSTSLSASQRHHANTVKETLISEVGTSWTSNDIENNRLYASYQSFDHYFDVSCRRDLQGESGAFSLGGSVWSFEKWNIVPHTDRIHVFSQRNIQPMDKFLTGKFVGPIDMNRRDCPHSCTPRPRESPQRPSCS